MNLAGKTAIVTGASRGLGPYIAKSLATKGMKIIALARDLKGLEKTKSDIMHIRKTENRENKPVEKGGGKREECREQKEKKRQDRGNNR